jgi:hypothetical protein
MCPPFCANDTETNHHGYVPANLDLDKSPRMVTALGSPRIGRAGVRMQPVLLQPEPRKWRDHMVTNPDQQWESKKKGKQKPGLRSGFITEVQLRPPTQSHTQGQCHHVPRAEGDIPRMSLLLLSFCL